MRAAKTFGLEATPAEMALMVKDHFLHILSTSRTSGHLFWEVLDVLGHKMLFNFPRSANAHSHLLVAWSFCSFPHSPT